MQRDGQGIKAINDRINALEGRVNEAVGVIARDRTDIIRETKLRKVNGAFELVQSLDPVTHNIDVFQVLKGSFQSGFFGEPKGALGNPAVIGAVGLLLRNPGLLGGVFGRTP